MKHFLFLSLMAICSLASYAHDFEVDGIYYNITSKKNLTCEVTYKGTDPYAGRTYMGTKVQIPSEVTCNGYTFTVTAVGDYAFYDSNYNVTMPNTIERIGKYAFASKYPDLYDDAPSVHIPFSVHEIDDYAFYRRHFLRYVYYDSPSKLVRIGNYAFDDTQAFISLKMPDSVIEIGDGAYRCSLSNIHGTAVWGWTLGKNVKRIGDEAFCGCTVKDLKIPDSLEYIGSRAFAGCFYTEQGIPSSYHSNIVIPEATSFIGYRAFTGPRYSLSVSEGNKYYCSESNIIFSKDKTKLISFPENTTGFYSIPQSVIEICEQAFYGSSLYSIKIPSSTKIIGPQAFWYAQFTRLVIPHTVDSIGKLGYSALREMQKLSDLVVDMRNIGNHFVYDCENLKTVTLGPHVETIYEDANSGYNTAFCYTRITDVINASAHPLSEYKCSALKNAKNKYDECPINNDLFVIETDNDTTKVLSYLDNDTTINISGFENNKVMICKTAFSNCSMLKEIIVPLSNPPACEEGAFLGVDKLNCCLFVPEESIDSYYKANEWSNFWNIRAIQGETTSVKSFSIDASPLLITLSEGNITIFGLRDGEIIKAFSLNGTQIATAKTIGNSANLNLSDMKGKVAVLSVGGKSAKVVVK